MHIDDAHEIDPIGKLVDHLAMKGADDTSPDEREANALTLDGWGAHEDWIRSVLRMAAKSSEISSENPECVHIRRSSSLGLWSSFSHLRMPCATCWV
jgi:hypothetical protein